MRPDVEAEVLAGLERRDGSGPESPLATGPLPKESVDDPERLRRERQLVLRRRWIPVTRLERLEEPGAFVTTELAGDRLVAVRDEKGERRVLHNVCRHRGAQVLRTEHGKATSLRCPYHAFEYGLDGRLRSCPAPQSFDGAVTVGETRLVPASSAEFAGWLWVLLEDAARTDRPTPLAQLGEAFADELENWPLADLRLVDRRHEEVEFDWKIGVEAFLEPFHVPAIHTRTAAPVVDYRGMTCRFDGEHSRMALPFRAPDAFEEDGILGSAAAAAGVTPFAGLNRAQMRAHFVYFVFPATIWMLFPSHAMIVTFLPTSTGRCRVSYELLAATPRDERARAFLDSMRPGYDRLLEEDLENLPFIQRGLTDSSHDGARLSRYERRIAHFRHALERALAMP